MTFKAARASLAAVLAATLLISEIPLVYAGSGTSQTQQDATVSRPRRGKNGQTIASSAENQTTAPGTVVPAEDSKPQSQKAESPAPSDNRQRRTSKEDSRPSASQTDLPQASDGSQQRREPPPFDRPPLRTQGRERTGDASRQRPSYPQTDSYPRTDPHTQSPTASKSPTPTPTARDDVDPSRPERSTARPPVLQRPSDSRPRDGSSSSDSRGGPPVLRRPSDSGSRDEGGSSDIKTGRPYPSGQQQGGTGQQQSGGDDEVIKLESTLVNIPLLVSDRSGRYIPQLSARDFALYEDGVEQKIASFGTEEVPFSVVLLLDVSPSVQGSIRDIQDAAIEFVRQLRAQDRVMVVSFDRHIHYLSDFTNDRRELEWAIRRAKTDNGTSVYDAVYETVDQKLRNIDGRKALILFSDGEDTSSSRASYNDAVELVAESDVLVYGLRYPGSGGGGGIQVDPWPRNPIPRIPVPFPFPWPWPTPRRRRGPFTFTANSAVASPAAQSWPRRRGGGGDFMKDITEAGGGPVYDAEKISDLSRVASRIADELRHVYVLSYYPTNPLSNGGFRRIRVSVKSRADIAVRHRPGYNARPGGSAKPTI